MVTRIEDHIMTASNDVENAATNLKKAKSWQEAARKKKVILGILAVVVVLILLLVILSEFGAFSGGDGETRIIERNNYIYVMPDGTRVESEVPREDLKVHMVPPTTTTTTTTTTNLPIISDDSEAPASA